MEIKEKGSYLVYPALYWHFLEKIEVIITKAIGIESVSAQCLNNANCQPPCIYGGCQTLLLDTEEHNTLKWTFLVLEPRDFIVWIFEYIFVW